MTFKKIAVVGLGLIGGSLAAALRESGEVGEVFGVERDAESLRFALENGITDSGASEIGPGMSGSEIVVVATYVDVIAQVAREVSGFVSPGTVVCDVGSVKASLVREMEKGPQNIRFVGAHPIAGRETSGVMESDSGLFSGKRCVVTPTESTNPEALSMVKTLFSLVGSEVVEMNPESHDEIFSLVSHLPHVVAYSLVSAVASGGGDRNLFDFSGGGLADFTRIAGSSPEMWAGIFIENREALLGAIRGFAGKLGEIEKAIASGNVEDLTVLLREAWDSKRNLGE
ncbi:MAG: prephenate dehydrogenase/arogenate dehydrogenase family protein [Candidatus Dadabacteria bacterium]|nr:prephenate dehydrogenase/arogenate dehydrogenase family protein [Candidatus Dadabacteria bacterium]MYB26705.1 prephenate dehydrogenase/arogenate dehydrogenase family protein [Candidatus Dadabacteria bacterium]